MILNKEDSEKSLEAQRGMIKCSLCGYSFERGRKNSCGSCPLNYGSCNFEKCPNCGFDIPQGSHVWTFITKKIDQFKKAGKK